MRAFPERRFRSRAGFKIAELMVAVGIFVLGGGIAYPLLIGDIGLYARNFSLNKSNNSLRFSLERLKQDIDMSIAPPWLVDYRVSGSAGVLTPKLATDASANGILLWVNLGPAYDMQGSGQNGTGSVPVTNTITLNRQASAPMPQINDRLVIMSPTPYSDGMPETVTMDTKTVQKPGRSIKAVNGQTSGTVADSTATSVTVKLDLSNTALPATITGPQSVYVVREVAYVAYTLNDAAGNPVERRLIRYANTADMTKGELLIRDVDPSPLEVDAATNAVIQPFNYYGGRTSLSALSINLPVRAIDYANAVTARQASASSEFNVYLRSNPQMAVKTAVQ